ncbi:unnamed protein product [Peniophora sp. CBMAI 1063]|nr:unnamed protein product [Peniophora sp. CBMAI 1063]
MSTQLELHITPCTIQDERCLDPDHWLGGRAHDSFISQAAASGNNRTRVQVDFSTGAIHVQSSSRRTSPNTRTHPVGAPPAYDAIASTNPPRPPIALEHTMVNELPPITCFICHPQDEHACLSRHVCSVYDSRSENVQLETDASNGPKSDALKQEPGPQAEPILHDPRSWWRRFVDDRSFAWKCARGILSCQGKLIAFYGRYGTIEDLCHYEIIRAARLLDEARIKLEEVQKICDRRPLEVRGEKDAAFADWIEKMRDAHSKALKALHTWAKE